MRTRNQIDAAYIKSLSNRIQKVITNYNQRSRGWYNFFGFLSDPDKINPHALLKQITKIVEEDPLKNLNDIFKQIANKHQEILKSVHKIIERAERKKESQLVSRLTPLTLFSLPESITVKSDLYSIKRYTGEVTRTLLNIDKGPLHADDYNLLKRIEILSKDIKQLVITVENLHHSYFTIYVNVLLKLRRGANNAELKSLLIHELCTQNESKWDSVMDDENLQIESALSRLSNESIFESTEQYSFCKEWSVSGSMNEYNNWVELMLEGNIKQDLDHNDYGKIVCEFRERFGRVDLCTGEQKKVLPAEEKTRLSREIEIWSYANMVKFFTQYMINYAIENPHADILKKGLEIKNNVLQELMKAVEDVCSPEYLNKNLHGTSAEWLKVFYNNAKSEKEIVGNVQRILINQKILTSATYQTDTYGRIVVPKVMNNEVEASNRNSM